MRPFRDRPIKQKLVIIVMATTTAALLLAGVGIVLADSLLFRAFLQRDLSALARIVADNSTAALSFNDPKTAAETLGALRARPHVAGACIYRLDATTLATYSRERPFTCPPAAGQDTIKIVGDGLVVSQHILLNGRRIGTLMLVYDLGEISERIRLYGSTVFGVLLASSLLAFLLSSRLRAVIATPVAQLVRATTSVSETGDYSIRARETLGRRTGRAGGPIQRDAGRHPVARQRTQKRPSRSRSRPAGGRKGAGAVPLHGRIDAAKDLHRQAQRRSGLLQPPVVDFTGLSFEQIEGLGLEPVRSSRRCRRERARVASVDRDRRALPFRAPLPPRRWQISVASQPGARHARRQRGDFHVDRIQHRYPRAEGKGRGTAARQRRPAAVRLFRQPRSSGAHPQRRRIQRTRAAALP